MHQMLTSKKVKKLLWKEIERERKRQTENVMVFICNVNLDKKIEEEKHCVVNKENYVSMI